MAAEPSQGEQRNEETQLPGKEPITMTVDSRVVSDVDIYSDEQILDPYQSYRHLRDLGPIVWMERHQAWVVTRYDQVRAVLKDTETFTSVGGVALNKEFNQVIQGTTLASDPPLHDELRDIVGSSLTPRALIERRAGIKEQAEQLVAGLVARGSFDAVTELAQVLPLSVVPDFIGLPSHGRDQMLSWGAAVFNAIGPLNERAKSAFADINSMGAYAAERVARRDLAPGSLGAGVLEAADAGRIPESQCSALLIDYLAPSLDTTISGVGNAIWLFGTRPDQWTMIRNDPSLIPNAFNEALRMETPIRGFCRHVTHPTTFEGVALNEGEPVLVLYAAANRDERKWDKPDDFDVTRRCADHVGFGFGVHGCAGQGLARIEAHAVLEALAKRVEHIEIVSSTRVLHNVIRALSSLQISVS
ncbi:cytochrome P450 [Mycolicibacterium moriokaense]|uniref:cytochrome P450 n=1 Tax=Mycolicibacterium moriokaense TaxID=39691 RepID=UPI001C653F7C|nr:cytochrome P450 [Mycolicibacterium moriokaense]